MSAIKNDVLQQFEASGGRVIFGYELEYEIGNLSDAEPLTKRADNFVIDELGEFPHRITVVTKNDDIFVFYPSENEDIHHVEMFIVAGCPAAEVKDYNGEEMP